MKIDKNIPLPRKWPFEHMEIGDSFLLAKDIKRSAVAVSASRFGNKNNVKFSIRKTPEGYRCWRIK